MNDDERLRYIADLDEHLRKIKWLEKANAELLAALTTEEVDGSTLIRTLRSAQKAILRFEPELYFEIAEELCAWAEKLDEHKGESE